MKLFLIDGVQVTEKTFRARQNYGEYIGAKFEAVDAPAKQPERKGR